MSDPFYRSAEIRWFLPGQSQKAKFLDWFKLPDQKLVVETENYVLQPEAPPFVKQELERPDEYLFLPDCDTASVKQRQGKLEVKALVAGPRPFSHGDVVGRVDQWVKWSFTPSKQTLQDGTKLGQQLNLEFDQSGPWCKVVKNRYLQKYSYDSGKVVAVSPDLRPETGCNVELTVIAVGSSAEPWITFGFEAFAPADRVMAIMAILDEAVKHFLAAHGPAPIQLDGRDSLSYSAWLAMLRRIHSQE